MCVDLPEALTELSLSDADVEYEGKQNITLQKVRQSGAEVLVTETSNEQDMTGVEVETRTFKISHLRELYVTRQHQSKVLYQKF